MKNLTAEQRLDSFIFGGFAIGKPEPERNYDEDPYMYLGSCHICSVDFYGLPDRMICKNCSNRIKS